MFSKKRDEAREEIPKIMSTESAESALQDLYDYYDLDQSILDDDSKKTLHDMRPKLIRGIQIGRLEIKRNENDDIVIVQTVGQAGSQVLEYNSELARALVAMKKYDVKDTYGRIYAMLGSLSGMSTDAIQMLKGADLKLAHAVGMTLMLAVN